MSTRTHETSSGRGDAELGTRRCFGPSFFLVHLRRFVRDRCPRPEESLPRVTIHLAGGTELALCHVVCLSTQWVALAVFDEGTAGTPMRTEVLPYDTICRVVIRSTDAEAAAGSYRTEHEPMLDDGTTAEKLLGAAQGGLGVAAEGVTWLRNDDP